MAFGWQSILVTPPVSKKLEPLPDNIKVIETSGYSRTDLRQYAREHLKAKKTYLKVKPILRFFYRRYSEIKHYPDAEKGWVPYAMQFADEILQTEKIDAILTSSPPVTTHIIANGLKKKHNVPWVADFRDLWTQNHNYSYSNLRKFFERKLEIKTLSNADALIAVSPRMADKLTVLHKGKQVYNITNGFDPEKMSKGKIDPTSNFTITYTGQIYKKQNAEKLLVALRDSISEGAMNRSDVEVRIFGPENEQLEEQTKKYGLTDVVRQYGIVPREACFQKQRESQVLWQITWEDPKEKGAYSGKIFEYLGAHRPILATGGFGGDVVEELIKETKSGYYCPSIESTKRELKKLYSEYQLKGTVSYHGSLKEINKYSYHEMAKKFAEVLEGCRNVSK